MKPHWETIDPKPLPPMTRRLLIIGGSISLGLATVGALTGAIMRLTRGVKDENKKGRIRR